jgi:hypothetical protein
MDVPAAGVRCAFFEADFTAGIRSLPRGEPPKTGPKERRHDQGSTD